VQESRECLADPRLCAAVVALFNFNGTIIETGTDSYRRAGTQDRAAHAEAADQPLHRLAGNRPWNPETDVQMSCDVRTRTGVVLEHIRLHARRLAST
jgi:hypothetical protein